MGVRMKKNSQRSVLKTMVHFFEIYYYIDPEEPAQSATLNNIVFKRYRAIVRTSTHVGFIGQEQKKGAIIILLDYVQVPGIVSPCRSFVAIF